MLTMADELTFLHRNHFPACDAHVNKHYDGYSTLQYMTAGTLYLRYDTTEYELSGKWFWPALPGPRIEFRSARPPETWDHRYVAFQGPLADRWRMDGILAHTPQPEPPDGDYRRRFDALLAIALDPGRWSRLRAINLLESILIDLAEARQQETLRAQTWLQHAISRLSDTDNPETDYGHLASQCNMAASTFRRRFRAATGMSAHQYAIHSHLAAARTLLRETDMPIKAIASKLGYTDIYYFTRQFSKHAGMPPGEFRKTRQI